MVFIYNLLVKKKRVKKNKLGKEYKVKEGKGF